MNSRIIALNNHDFLLIFFVISLLVYIVKYYIFKKYQTKRYWIYPVFIFYLLAVIDYTLMPIFIYSHEELVSFYGGSARQSWKAYCQFIPFYTIQEYLVQGNLYQIVGNIILLMPMPFFIYMLAKKISIRGLIISGCEVSLGIELTQACIDFLTGCANRICDVDDLILNSVGVVISVGMICVIRKITICRRLYYILVYRKNKI